MSSKKPFTDRDIRQRGIVSPEKLKKIVAAVVGVGAVGHQVARQLATMGVHKLILIDHDKVGVENLAAQGFREADLGKPKVDVVAAECGELNSEIEIKSFQQKFRKGMIMDLDLDDELVVFSCVDDMDARKQILKDTFTASSLFIDGRMIAEVFSVYCVRDSDDREHYEGTLFPSSEMFAASCTAKTTIYCANVISGMMVAQMAKHMRGVPLDREFHVNILAGTLQYASEAVPAEA